MSFAAPEGPRLEAKPGQGCGRRQSQREGWGCAGHPSAVGSPGVGREASQRPGELLEARFQQLVDDDDDIPTTAFGAAAGLWCRQGRVQG